MADRKNNDGFALYKCEVSELIPALQTEYLEMKPEFWKMYSRRRTCMIPNQDMFPLGTYWSSSVKLIEKVENQ